MEKGNSLIEITLNPDFTLKIELGVYEKQVIANRFKDCVHQYTMMGKWLDDISVPTEQKETYLPLFLNLHASLNFLMNLQRLAGVSERDLAETLNIPF